MATKKQIAANRRNAKKSTGPKTIEGKDRARLNALKHGLCERAIGVLDHEDYAEFQAFRAQLLSEHNPVGALETAMVDQIARAYWRMLRATRMETANFNLQMQDMEKTMLRFMESEHGKEAADRAAAEEHDQDAALGFCFEDHQKLWQLHLRYQTTATRDFHRAINTLLKLQQVRLRNGSKPPLVARASACSVIPFPTAQTKQTTATSRKLASFRNARQTPGIGIEPGGRHEHGPAA